MAARLWESEVGARRHDLGRLEHRGYLSYEPRLHGRDRIRVRHRPVQYILQQAGLLGSGGPCMMSSPLGFAADAVVNGEEAVGIVSYATPGFVLRCGLLCQSTRLILKK